MLWTWHISNSGIKKLKRRRKTKRSVAKKIKTNWAETCQRMTGLYEKSFQRKPATFYPLSQFPSAPWKPNKSMYKSDHYTITATGLMEALIKILILQHTAPHVRLQLKYRHSNSTGETSMRAKQMQSLQLPFLCAVFNLKYITDNNQQEVFLALERRVEQDSHCMCLSEAGKAVSCSSLICSD